MKFITSSDNLLKTIQPLIGIVGNNPALPIIENILLELNQKTCGNVAFYSVSLLLLLHNTGCSISEYVFKRAKNVRKPICR